ncbi:hypothetical protein HY008_02965 [Candidatus Woesebacteria bacterium]|nr:hypothetical protein [Candidatus Woesebacteria bacterium]
MGIRNAFIRDFRELELRPDKEGDFDEDAQNKFREGIDILNFLVTIHKIVNNYGKIR